MFIDYTFNAAKPYYIINRSEQMLLTIRSM